MLNICEKPIQGSTYIQNANFTLGGAVWVRYSLENILAGPVVQLSTMNNIGFGVMIDVAM